MELKNNTDNLKNEIESTKFYLEWNHKSSKEWKTVKYNVKKAINVEENFSEADSLNKMIDCLKDENENWMTQQMAEAPD